MRASPAGIGGDGQGRLVLCLRRSVDVTLAACVLPPATTLTLPNVDLGGVEDDRRRGRVEPDGDALRCPVNVASARSGSTARS